jgi:hypothetical protein
MGYLKNKTCYLSGAIEHDTPTGVNWRNEPIRVLTERFGIDVFDPNADPKQQKAYQLTEHTKSKNLKGIQDIAWGFVRKDLGVVDRTDFIIARFAYEKVYYPSDIPEIIRLASEGRAYEAIGHMRQVPTTGTIHEIILSDTQHKPTLLICERGAEYLPKWLIGFIKLDYLFGSWNQVYDYLAEVDDGKRKDDKRWSLTYGLI